MLHGNHIYCQILVLTVCLRDYILCRPVSGILFNVFIQLSNRGEPKWMSIAMRNAYRELALFYNASRTSSHHDFPLIGIYSVRSSVEMCEMGR